MKKLVFLLPILVLLYACDSGTTGGATSGKDISMTTVDDSMYYAFGGSLISNLGLEGLKLNASAFEAGINGQIAGNSTMNDQSALQKMQGFGAELQARQGRPVTAEDPVNTDLDSISYAYGVYFTKQLNELDLNMKPQAFVAGFNDVNEGADMFTPETSKRLMDEFNRLANEKVKAKQAIDNAAAAGENKQKGLAFLTENKTKEGVIEHESGLQYKVLKSGAAGGASPTIADKVTIHYAGRLLDGSEFDSSYSRGEDPVTFPLNGLIEGWKIALPMMKPGDKWTIWCPSEIAYGDGGNPRIPPGSTLEFDIEYFGIGE